MRDKRWLSIGWVGGWDAGVELGWGEGAAVVCYRFQGHAHAHTDRRRPPPPFFPRTTRARTDFTKPTERAGYLLNLTKNGVEPLDILTAAMNSRGWKARRTSWMLARLWVGAGCARGCG